MNLTSWIVFSELILLVITLYWGISCRRRTRSPRLRDNLVATEAISFNLSPTTNKPILVEGPLNIGGKISVNAKQARIVGVLIEAYDLENGSWYFTIEVPKVSGLRIRAQLEEHNIPYVEN